MLGAAGNVARNVAALGGEVALVGVIGKDDGGRQAKDLIAAEPRIEGYLITDPDRPTTIKTRFVSAGQQLLRVDEETTRPVAGDVERQLVRTIADAARGAGAILISDYGKGVVTAPVIEAARAAAEREGRGADRRFQGALVRPLRRGRHHQAQRRRARPRRRPADRDRRRDRGGAGAGADALPLQGGAGDTRGQGHVAGGARRGGAPLPPPAAGGVRHVRAQATRRWPRSARRCRPARRWARRSSSRCWPPASWCRRRAPPPPRPTR